jgi:hypothetical protein
MFDHLTTDQKGAIAEQAIVAAALKRGIDVYTADEIDAYAASCAELDRCYFLPISRFLRKTTIQLRLAPARNSQRRRVNWAGDFLLEDLDFLAASPLGP